MNLDQLQAAAADNQWGAIFPELALGCLALLLLVFELALPKAQHGRIPLLAIAGHSNLGMALAIGRRARASMSCRW